MLVTDRDPELNLEDPTSPGHQTTQSGWQTIETINSIHDDSTRSSALGTSLFGDGLNHLPMFSTQSGARAGLSVTPVNKGSTLNSNTLKGIPSLNAIKRITDKAGTYLKGNYEQFLSLLYILLTVPFCRRRAQGSTRRTIYFWHQFGFV